MNEWRASMVFSQMVFHRYQFNKRPSTSAERRPKFTLELVLLSTSALRVTERDSNQRYDVDK